MMGQRYATMVLLFGIIAYGCGETPAGPYLSMDRTSHEFSATDAGDGQTEFTLTNSGNRTLEIRDVVSSCGCAVAQMPVNSLATGKSTTLRVRMTRPPIGSRLATVAVFTNSEATPATELSLHARAIDSHPRIAQILPRRVNLYMVSGGPAEALVTMISFESRRQRFIESLQSDLPFVNVELAAMSDTASFDDEYVQRKYVWRVAVRPGAPLGHFSGKLRATTSSKLNQAIVVPLDGIVRSEVFAEPATLFVSCSNVDEPAPKPMTVVLRGMANQPRSIASLAVDAPWLKAEKVEQHFDSAGRRQASVVIRIIARPDRFPARGNVTIVSASSPERLQIPVIVTMTNEGISPLARAAKGSTSSEVQIRARPTSD